MSRREHSASELFRKLGGSSSNEALIDTVIGELQKEGLQSDERFTEAFVHNRIERGYGPLRIHQELRQKGISDALIRDYVDVNDPDWQQRASRARNKRFGHQLPTNYKEKAKQSRFLQQRGFSGEQIRRVIEEDE